MSDKKIGLDIDGVLCNFAQGAIREGKRLGIDGFADSWQDVDHWFLSTCKTSSPFDQLWPHIKFNIPFWWNLEPLPYSVPLDFKVDRYVTSRPIESDVTKQWLLLHGFPDAQVITVSNPKDKLEHVRDLDLFVDDHWETVRHLRENGANAALYWAPYQEGHDIADLPLIRHLSEVQYYDESLR